MKNRQEADQVGIFHVKHQCLSPKQWYRPQHSTNHKGSHVIHSGSRVRGTLSQCKTSHAHETNAPQNETPATPNANPNRQLHGIWHGDTQDHSKDHKRNGHVFLLAPQLQATATISLLLVTRHNKFCQLLDQASPSSPSQTNVKNFPN